MKFKDFKNTDEYRRAVILEAFDVNGIEFDSNYPEEKLEEMDVLKHEVCGGWLSVVLK